MSEMVIGLHPRDVVVTLTNDTWWVDGRTLQMSRRRAKELALHLTSALEYGETIDLEGEDG